MIPSGEQRRLLAPTRVRRRGLGPYRSLNSPWIFLGKKDEVGNESGDLRGERRKGIRRKQPAFQLLMGRELRKVELR